MKKRLVALALAASMILELFPSSILTAFATVDEPTARIEQPAEPVSSEADENNEPAVPTAGDALVIEEPTREVTGTVAEEPAQNDDTVIEGPATEEPVTDPPAKEENTEKTESENGAKAGGGPLRAIQYHTLTFMVDGEVFGDPITVAQGSNIGTEDMPVAPEKTVEGGRVVFEGWY